MNEHYRWNRCKDGVDFKSHVGLKFNKVPYFYPLLMVEADVCPIVAVWSNRL